jgi:hypothetical protein
VAAGRTLAANLPRLKRKPRPLPILKPYIDRRRPLRRISGFLFPIGLGFVCLIYGFFFALTAPFLLIPFAVPIVFLVLLAIWALPDTPHAPIKTMEVFYAGVLTSLVIWPNYLALALPGLPWITMLRLTSFPMSFLLLISLSTSKTFRSGIAETLRGVPGLIPALIAMATIQFITLPLSHGISDSVQQVVLNMIYIFGILLIGCWIFRIPGRVTRYVNLIVLLGIPIAIITIIESRYHKALWLGHIPPFLKVNDPVALRILSATTRGATGLFRTKATFSTPLGLAEYMALLSPFCIHFFMSKYNIFIRVAALVGVGVAFFCIRMTDARLGIVGMFVSALMYFFLWALRRLRRDKSDLFAAAIAYGYPAIFAMAMAAAIFVHRIHVLVFGSGAQASSNDARKSQLTMGIPKLLSNPIGHGSGQAGITLGYAPGDFITVDNYYLSLALDWGFIGLFSFLAIFLLTIRAGVKVVMEAPPGDDDKEAALMLPLIVALSAFLVIKLVFSQNDNHPLVYCILGMTLGLIYRSRIATAGIKTAEASKAQSAKAKPGRNLQGVRQPVAAALRPPKPGLRR